MKGWQERYLVKWDATSGRNGSVARAACEGLLEMERFGYETGATQQCATTLLLDLAMAFARVSVASRLEVGCAFAFPKTDPEDVVWIFCIREEFSFEGCFAEPLQNLTTILSGSTLNCAIRCRML